MRFILSAINLFIRLVTSSHVSVTVEIMSVTGQGQDPFMMAWILVESVVCSLRPCSMFLQRIEPSFGKWDPHLC